MVFFVNMLVFFQMASMAAALMPMSQRLTFPRPTIQSGMSKSRLYSTVLEPTATTTTTSDVVVSGEPTAWDCDNEANCVQVAACDEEKCRTSLDVRIHGTWYDLSGMYLIG